MKRDKRGRFVQVYFDDPSILKLKTPTHLLKGRKVTEEILERMRSMRNNGDSYRYISLKTGISKTQVMYHLDPQHKSKAKERYKRHRSKYIEPSEHKRERMREYSSRLINGGFPLRAKQRTSLRLKRLIKKHDNT